MITASKLLRNCGHSRVLGDAPPRTQKERDARARRDAAAGRGKTFHGAIEEWAKTGSPGVVEDPEIQGWIDLLASQWAPPPTTQLEVPWGLTPGGDHEYVDEPQPHVYVASAGTDVRVLTAGRADARWLASEWLYVVDWKTGRWPVTPAVRNLQVNAAGISLAREVAARGYVPGVYYARDGVFDWGEPVELGSLAHAEMFADIKAAALLDNEPRPGAWCGDCWEKRSCAHAQKEATS